MRSRISVVFVFVIALASLALVPQPQLEGRSPIVPQAKVLGGGSAVNAMVYIRGQAEDYDSWDEALGGAGWSYADLLPHFIKQEGNDHLASRRMVPPKS